MKVSWALTKEIEVIGEGTDETIWSRLRGLKKSSNNRAQTGVEWFVDGLE